jgi:probable rRNA maturation factor
MPRRENPTIQRRPEASGGDPLLTVTNRQRRVRIELKKLRERVRRALPLCLAAPGADAPLVLADLPEVTISVVSPEVMSRVHVEFLQIEGPTDVITFPYGEILICAAIALENAERFRTDLQDEITLYAIHGLLHLHGYDDISPVSARRMHSVQVNILNAVRKCA